MDVVAHTYQQFCQRFDGPPRLFYAPGRVNLIGEHTDYNDGFVLPAAISFGTCVAIRNRQDAALVLYSTEFGDQTTINLEEPPTHYKRGWSDYVHGVALVLQQSGHRVRGADILVHGNVPIGAGLSSSASIEVAAALAFTAANELSISSKDLALICQRAENEFVGTRCGIMDQFVSVHGQPESALLLDCRSLHFEIVPIPSGVSLVICNSMVKHNLAAGEYNTRRAECEEGVRLLKQSLPRITALRDVSSADLEQHRDLLPATVYRRCRHVVTENERVLSAVQALRSGDLQLVGKLMGESHSSLRDDYEVSCVELDMLVELASSLPGIIGARMTGGGFGGCTINLVQDQAVEAFRSGIKSGYQDRIGIAPEVYVSAAAAGAREIATSNRLATC
ncbi:MAG: galactokinase [Acidobacteriales bacterium]|nr:galactokinase [Terriglobales bacterium]